MTKPLHPDRPEKPKLEGYLRAAQRDIEWVVWSYGKYRAEFSVASLTPGEVKPVVRASGEGVTVFRALFDAAARCVDMGADRGAVLEGLAAALEVITGSTKVTPRNTWAVPSRESKLKNERPLA